MDVFQVVKALRVHKPGAVPSVVSSSAAYIVGGLYHYKSQTLFSRACIPTHTMQVVLINSQYQDVLKAASSLCTVD